MGDTFSPVVWERVVIRKLFARIRRDVNIMKLIKLGMIIGKDCSIADDCVVDYSHCWLIQIGDRVTITSKCMVLAHDASMKRALGKTKIGPVVIGNDVFIGVNTVVLPNTHIGENTIIGAGSVVSGEIKANSVYAGVPAKWLCSKDEFLKKHTDLMKNSPNFDETWTLRKRISRSKRAQMKEMLGRGVGYVE